MSFINDFRIDRLDKKINAKIDELNATEKKFMNYFKDNEMNFHLTRIKEVYRTYLVVQKKIEILTNRFNEYDSMRDYISIMRKFHEDIKTEKNKTTETLKQENVLNDFIDKYEKDSPLPQKPIEQTKKELSAHDKMVKYINSKSKIDGKYLVMYSSLLRDSDRLSDQVDEMRSRINNEIETAKNMSDYIKLLQDDINKLIIKRNKLSKTTQQTIKSHVLDSKENCLLDYRNVAEEEAKDYNAWQWLANPTNAHSLRHFETILNSEIPEAWLTNIINKEKLL